MAQFSARVDYTHSGKIKQKVGGVLVKASGQTESAVVAELKKKHPGDEIIIHKITWL